MSDDRGRAMPGPARQLADTRDYPMHKGSTLKTSVKRIDMLHGDAYIPDTFYHAGDIFYISGLAETSPTVVISSL